MTSSTSPITAMRPSARVLITLLAALSLVFSQMTIFSPQSAQANANFYFAGQIVLSNGTVIDLGDPNVEASWTGPAGQDVHIEGFAWAGDGDNSGPEFHLSCSATLNGTEVTIDGGGGTHTIVDFAIYRDNINNATEPLTLKCTASTFEEVPSGTVSLDEECDPSGVRYQVTNDGDGDVFWELTGTAAGASVDKSGTILEGGAALNEFLTLNEDDSYDLTLEVFAGTDNQGTSLNDTSLSGTINCIQQNPDIGIVKTAVSADVDFSFIDGTLTVSLTEGESAEITYEYLITNEGDEDLDTLELEDDVIGDLTDEFVDAVDAKYGATLPVDGDVTVTATYTTTADDFTTGSVTNVATVTGTGVTSGDAVEADDDETINITGVLGVVFEPGISVEKTVIGGVNGNNVVTFNADGDPVDVTYQFVVTNTGNEDLNTLTVLDNKIGELTDVFLATLGGTVLPVGESVTFTAVHEVEIDDFTAGSLTNVVEVTGVGVESGGEVDDSDNETISFLQVAGVVIVDSQPPTEVAGTTLPRTGFDTGVLAGLGLLLAALGAGALLLGRRREEGDLS